MAEREDKLGEFVYLAFSAEDQTVIEYVASHRDAKFTLDDIYKRVKESSDSQEIFMEECVDVSFILGVKAKQIKIDAEPQNAITIAIYGSEYGFIVKRAVMDYAENILTVLYDKNGDPDNEATARILNDEQLRLLKFSREWKNTYPGEPGLLFDMKKDKQLEKDKRVKLAKMKVEKKSAAMAPQRNPRRGDITSEQPKRRLVPIDQIELEDVLIRAFKQDIPVYGIVPRQSKPKSGTKRQATPDAKDLPREQVPRTVEAQMNSFFKYEGSKYIPVPFTEYVMLVATSERVRRAFLQFCGDVDFILQVNDLAITYESQGVALNPVIVCMLQSRVNCKVNYAESFVVPRGSGSDYVFDYVLSVRYVQDRGLEKLDNVKLIDEKYISQIVDACGWVEYQDLDETSKRHLYPPQRAAAVHFSGRFVDSSV